MWGDNAHVANQYVNKKHILLNTYLYMIMVIDVLC